MSGDSGQAETQGWFYDTLLPFLRKELKDSPTRRLGAIRLFIIAMGIALFSLTLRPPHLASVAITIALGLSPYANAGQAIILTGRMFAALALTSLVGVLSLALWGDQPWFLMPWSMLVITLGLFHSRVTGLPSQIIATWYPMVVLYSVATPDENFYTALWVIPIMGGMGTLLYLAVQTVIRPVDPLKLLEDSLVKSLAAVEEICRSRLENRLQQTGVKLPAGTVPGGLNQKYALLAHTITRHPALRPLRHTYEALVVELNGLGSIANWYANTLLEQHHPPTATLQQQMPYIIDACQKLQQGIREHRPVADEVLAELDAHRYHDEQGPSVQSILTTLENALIRTATLLGILEGNGRPPLQAESGPIETEEFWPNWLGYAFWYQHRETLQFALKFALAAMINALLVQALDWPSISTAIVTAVVLAQSSMGANYRKSILRFAGAVLGGSLAYTYLLLGQPLIETLVGFAIVTAPIWALIAWIAAGGPTTAYVGQQAGYAFAICILHDFGQVWDLQLSRDRALGILIGVIVVGLLDYSLWPRRSYRLADRRVAEALRLLKKLTAWPGSAPSFIRSHVLPPRLAIDKELTAALDLVHEGDFEPQANAQTKAQILQRIETVHTLSGLLSIRVRYRLTGGLSFEELPDYYQNLTKIFDQGLAETLDSIALGIESPQRIDTSKLHFTLTRLESLSHAWYDTSHRDEHIGRAVQLRRALDWQILRQMDTLAGLANSGANMG